MGTFTENPCARMTILWNKRRTNVDFSSKCWFGVDVGDVGASKRILVREWEFHVQFWLKKLFFIKNVDFSLEKCRFGAHRGVLHYVLKREWALPRKNGNFELGICVKERGGRAARCMGSVPVAEMLASEARRARTSGRVDPAYGDPSLCLFPSDRSRESCGP